MSDAAPGQGADTTRPTTTPSASTRTSTDAALRQPVSMGRYQLLFPIGHGGMSDVYLAVVTSAAGVNKILVIKQLRASLLDEAEGLSMFMDEARLAARLHHPNVVQTFEVGQEGPIPYMTMEFLDGQPLHRILKRIGVGSERPLSLAMRLRITAEMLEALHYAHELRDYDGSPMQVVHRDVSPQNLFLTYDGQIKLVDFGIAKASDTITQTEGRGLKGKLTYMSPQQAAGEALDRRCDVFAAGVMLWEMLGGRRLWQDCTEATIARRLVDHDLPPLALEGVDPRLVAICERALAPDVDARYPTAEAFRVDLEHYMDTEDLDASARAIGRRVSEAFVEERAQTRARIDRELLRHIGGDVDAGGDSSPSYELSFAGWDREDSSERTGQTLRSGEYDPAAPPDEITADYGPSLAPEPKPEPERPPPTREISGVIGAPSLAEIEARATPPAAARFPWTAGAILVVGLGLIGLVVFGDRGGEAPTSAAAESAETAKSDADAPADSPTGEASTPLPAPGTGDCDSPTGTKPRVALSGEIDEDATLRCDRDYILSFNTRVARGVTLTIEPGTTIYGERETKGTLIIQPGARLIAEGTPERPIVFTSSQPETERRPGDWGGVIILGRAPINLRDVLGQPMLGEVEGVTGVARYGGDDPDDDSGVLRYVRIEYPGVELAPANEINGLTLAGVGRGTTIDHVEVLASSDDCFEFFGGTVDATHLVCDAPGDDAFDFDNGYSGRLQYLVVRDHGLGVAGDAKVGNAFEIDNDPNGTLAEPRTRPIVANASLCGVAGGKSASYAVLARRASAARLYAVVVSGFDYAVDVRDPSTELELSGVGLVGQAPAETGERDDDGGFDELAWIAEPRRGLTRDLAGFGCDDPAQSMLPAAPLQPPDGFEGPPEDGFFTPSDSLGAFAGPGDDWTRPWARWTSPG